MQPAGLDLPRGAVTRDTLRVAGWTTEAIDAAVRRGLLASMTRGVLLAPEPREVLVERCRGALLSQRPDAVIWSRTAALLHGVTWVPEAWHAETQPCVAAQRDDLTRSARNGVRRRIAWVPEDEIVEIDGVRVTSPARTVADVARFEPTRTALRVADWMLSNGRCTPDDLAGVLARMARLRGVVGARRIAEIARPGVGSPMETEARLQIIDAGLPVPDVNLTIVTAGVVEAQGDLGYWRWLIWIDYDGWDVHAEAMRSGTQFSRDLWLEARGWLVLHLRLQQLASSYQYLRTLERWIAEAPARIARLDPRRAPEIAAAQAALGLLAA